ncbi:MAG: membrane protein insertion efficiency factor YidD [Sulfurovum sp.]
MLNKKFYLTPIKGYQYISKMLPASCRYYPSCSEYASQQFEFNAPHKALWESSLRILRCNQLFIGGIDYPLVQFSAPLLKLNRDCGKIKIKYWIVPKLMDDNNRLFYIIKDFDVINSTSKC